MSAAAVIVSRFVLMYLTNLLFCFDCNASGNGNLWMGYASGNFFLYLWCFGTAVLPILPLCIALIFGAVIQAIGARMKHKGVGIALLTLIFGIALMGVSMFFSWNAESMDMRQLENDGPSCDGHSEKNVSAGLDLRKGGCKRRVFRIDWLVRCFGGDSCRICFYPEKIFYRYMRFVEYGIGKKIIINWKVKGRIR